MKRYVSVSSVMLLYIIVAICCSKSGKEVQPPPTVKDTAAEMLTYSINNMKAEVAISPSLINLRFADSVYAPKDLVATFTLSPGSSATIGGTAQVSGETKNNYTGFLNYLVKNKSGVEKHWIVAATNNDYTYDWGLGYFLKQSLSNDRTYDWYYTQAGTGAYSQINCAPTCAAMCMKWADPNFKGTPEEARNHFPGNKELWSLRTIQDCFDDYGFANKGMALGNTPEETRDILKEQLEAGNIVVLLLDMGSIRSYQGASKEPHVDRYYTDRFNHCIVAYGYKEVDGEFYLQVNDPWNFGSLYNNGTPKGKGRFYRYEDIARACMSMGNYAQVVLKR